ncbi:NADPH-dependent FMN reductase [Paracoccus aminophilus]|uniref:NADPH:quinone oxidoreductase n=1 Tax=Paracoccus aminophilus JCM 7686 TaxID=1367847 RepID=S5Y7I6_PARAH|nr:NADPH-dependent FMN reductase [Paracoccus aminophilus]AGT07303.1 NADPH:quinone oxidoreductase [Paracoccus aminophilus JCM 7686]
MTTILALAGSLRRASYNRGLQRAAIEASGADFEVIGGHIDEVPLYNGDLEAEFGLPAPVRRLQEQLAAADGLLLISPEYNGGLPGVLKNAVDWMSRGEGLRAFRDKPAAVIGASEGSFGTVLGQAQWAQIFRKLGMAPWYGRQLMVTTAAQRFDAEGNLTDDEIRKRLHDYLAAFAHHLAR